MTFHVLLTLRGYYLLGERNIRYNSGDNESKIRIKKTQKNTKIQIGSNICEISNLALF